MEGIPRCLPQKRMVFVEASKEGIYNPENQEGYPK